jgi:hypothetical protein
VYQSNREMALKIESNKEKPKLWRPPSNQTSNPSSHVLLLPLV